MTLRLDNNSIVSLEPLAGAGWLNELSVDQNPLQGLQGLEDLELGDLSAEGAGLTHVTDLAPLAGHTWLRDRQRHLLAGVDRRGAVGPRSLRPHGPRGQPARRQSGSLVVHCGSW